MPDRSELPYRPCVGVVLANPDGLVFAGERMEVPGAWQMPQGGVDAGEAPGTAALRELREETSVTSDLVTVEAETPEWLVYDFPQDLSGRIWNGRYRGQKQLWYLMRYHGSDDQIDIKTAHPEFARWQWMTPDALIGAIIAFKRDVYAEVMRQFRDRL